MKPWPFAFAASLVVNVALAAFILLRPPPGNIPPPPKENSSPNPVTAEERGRVAALQAALASGDPTALAAVGFPPEAIRALIVGRAFDKLQARMRAMTTVRKEDAKYWQTGAQIEDLKTARERQLEERNAPREFSDALHQAYGYDLETLLNGNESRYAFLPVAKREKLRRIEQDYADLEAQVEANYYDGVQLSADREKLALLRREKERDFAAVLTAEEREQLALRSSPSASQVQGRYGSVLQTEEEYKKIFLLQKAFDDRFSFPEGADRETTDAISRARHEAEPKLREEINTLLGPDRIAALRRANDPDRSVATAIALRLGLPSESTNAVVGLRDRYAAQSQRILGDPILNPREREAQIKNLVAKAEGDLRATLGPDGAEAYLQRAQWIDLLKSGEAISTDPKDAPLEIDILVTPVFPARSPSPAPKPAGE